MSNKTPVVRIDKSRQEVFLKDKLVKLAPKEYRLLVALQESNRTMTRDELIAKGWSDERGILVGERTVDQHIARLRGRFSVPIIETVPTFGYKYVGA